jgi:short-subunit dehydrogenase
VELAGTIALVTGASSGIGRAVALELADHGAHVLVHGRDSERVTEVADLTGGTPLVAELSDPRQRERLVAQAVQARGRVDVLVANAGVGWAGPFTDMTADDVQGLVDVDLLAPIDLTRRLLPGMVERGSGALCFVSSVAGRTAVAGEAVYAAAKAGIDAFADSLRAEAHDCGVQVGVVVPGVVDTPFFARRGRPYHRAVPRPVAPQAVASAVVQCLVDGSPEVWAPRWLRVAPVVRAVAPAPYRWLHSRFGGGARLNDRLSGHQVGGTWP